MSRSPRPFGKGCSVPGCEGGHKGHGYCDKHYQRFKKYGDPNRLVRVIPPFEERLWTKVEFPRGLMGCWVWTAGVSGGGYGTIRLSEPRRNENAHRFMYIRYRGQPAADSVLDHFMFPSDGCVGRRCCNPWHLVPTTRAANSSRSINTFKTHCPQGHPYDDENTYHPPGKPNARMCWACIRARRGAAREARRQAVA